MDQQQQQFPQGELNLPRSQARDIPDKKSDVLHPHSRNNSSTNSDPLALQPNRPGEEDEMPARGTVRLSSPSPTSSYSYSSSIASCSSPSLPPKPSNPYHKPPHSIVQPRAVSPMNFTNGSSNKRRSNPIDGTTATTNGTTVGTNTADSTNNNINNAGSQSPISPSSISSASRTPPLLPRSQHEGDNRGYVTMVGDSEVRSDVDLAALQQLYLPDNDSAFRLVDLQDKTISYRHSPSFPAVKALPPMERRRILVTGGAGFVGSHLVDRLMLMGHEVIILDNFFTGSKKNVQHWLGHPHFELIRHDVVDPFMIEVDQIYHLACPASPPHYQYNPIKTVKTSVMGTINMLGLAKRTKARFLLASTSEVYGDPEQHPQKETYWGHVNPIGPRACYDEGKRVAETLTYSYMQQDDVDVRVARIFNTFGPRMNEHDGRVVSNFIMQALKGEELTLYGDGQQTRSFQYIHDLIDGLILLMNNDYKEPVNLGNPEEFTIREFAERIRDEVNSNVQIRFLPPAQDDPQKRRPDITRACEHLGWSPRFSVGQGIAETVEYFRRTLQEQRMYE